MWPRIAIEISFQITTSVVLDMFEMGLSPIGLGTVCSDAPPSYG